MESKDPTHTAAQAFRQLASEYLANEIERIETGVGRTIQNPFTGQETTTSVSPAAKAFRELLNKHGILQDPESLASFKEALDSYTHSLMFSLCTALDGSAVFPNREQIEVTLNEAPLDGCMHEVYYRDTSS